jgi:Peptidase family M23/RTX calcium-binding nonapeptide repeat (4 copies)
VSHPLKRSLSLACALIALPVLLPVSARAADADVFARGSEWCATTRPGHGTLNDPDEGRFGPALDIGSPKDFRWPVYAPGDGRVKVYSRGYGSGWGNSVIWTSSGGDERIHLAHLDSFGATGSVAAGEMVGRVGETGIASGPHLHLSAQRDGDAAPVVLMGQRIRSGRCYVSTGPIPRYCFGRPVTVLGTSRDDVIEGTYTRDVVMARGGNDAVNGRGGPDRICGGGGDDNLRGRVGVDLLDGGWGGDRLTGGAAEDRLLGKSGDDRILGHLRNDVLEGAQGYDVLDGGPGTDECTGGEERINCP